MSNLSLLDAENKNLRQLLIGWALLILSTPLYIVAVLKGTYSFLSNPPEQLSAMFFRPLANLIALVYGTIPGMGRLWSITPDPNLAKWGDPSNFGFYSFVALVFGLMLVGSRFRLSAKNVSDHIASTRQKAQKDQWMNEISGCQPRSSAATVSDLIQISIPLGQDQRWSISISWQDRSRLRPLEVGLGIIIAIIAYVIGQAITVWLGLSH